MDNKARYYIDVYGDIHETLYEAEFFGLAKTVEIDGFYVGSRDEMKAHALSRGIEVVG